MTRRIDIDNLGDRIALHAANLDAATHRLLTDVRAFDQAGGWVAHGAKSMSDWLSWRVGWDLTTAREHVRVATKLGSLPLIDDALRRGELSYSKVRAITRVATSENEATFLEQARYSTGAQLDQICRKYAVVRRHDTDVEPRDDQARRYIRRTDTADGMVKLEAVLHPEEAAMVWAALERIATERCREKPEVASDEGSAEASTPFDFADTHASSARDASAQPQTLGDSVHARDPFAVQDSSAEAPTLEVVHTRSVRGSRRFRGSADSRFRPHTRPGRAPQKDASSGKPRAVTPFERADALVELAMQVLHGRHGQRTPTDLVVTVTAEALSDTNPDATDVSVSPDGTWLSAVATRRLACDCAVTEVVQDERGTPISIGRKRRTISGAMKRALHRRDKTCRFPGCNARAFLQGHHIEHWADGGSTDLQNIALLCSHHHRYLHEYGFTIKGDPARELQFFDRGGRLVPDVPERPLVHDSGWTAILADNTDLAITCDTPACGWDGSRVDYPACVDALVHADGGRGPLPLGRAS